MRAEYDLKGGRSNPHAKRLGTAGRKALADQYLESEHLVRLDDDIATAFPTAEDVNEALRLVLRIRETAPKPRARRTRVRAQR